MEGEGFEPSGALRPHRFSRPALSAAQAPLRFPLLYLPPGVLSQERGSGPDDVRYEVFGARLLMALDGAERVSGAERLQPIRWGQALPLHFRLARKNRLSERVVHREKLREDLPARIAAAHACIASLAAAASAEFARGVARGRSAATTSANAAQCPDPAAVRRPRSPCPRAG